MVKLGLKQAISLAYVTEQARGLNATVNLHVNEANSVELVMQPAIADMYGDDSYASADVYATL
jgi:hypothetical protein